MSREIESMLMPGTAHLDPDTAEVLNNRKPFGIESVLVTGYGWLLNRIAIEVAASRGHSVPDCLAAAVEVAEASKCHWVNFYQDGLIEEDLNRWEG